MTTILEAVTETVVPLIGTVFQVMTGNALLVTFVGISVVTAGFRVFRSARRTAGG